MDAAMITAIGALIGAPMAAAAAVYGTRGASRAAREGGSSPDTTALPSG
ncbi:hypothetical protein OG883_26035 [Streptomyces sp. NBC_01142]|nr:hypothetical protein [Streptomyces sp. NBC_01142]MCX4823284.1 hypothetical protein [Streptomyces sp. NBC_01142]